MKLILYFTQAVGKGKYFFIFSKFSNSFDRSLINTFLAEMDGFKQRDHIFVMGATNSEKDLDKAALRPGRFDKIIHVPIPDKKGRKDIFDLYLNKIKMPVKEDITSDLLSKMTPGFTGAEIENMVNTAIISAVDFDKTFISRQDFEDARDRVVLGIKRRIKNSNANVRSLLQTAIHQAGHTLICYKDKTCNKGIHKVSIVPRGESKGKTSTLLDDMEGTKEEFLSMIDMSLAGILAEELYFGQEKVGIGCGNDLSRATSLAKNMVKNYAMDNKFGYMVVEDDNYVSHRISGDTRNDLDVAVSNILNARSLIVKQNLQESISDLKSLAQKLIDYEELNRNDIENILTGKDVGDNDKREKKRNIRIEGIAL
jgi:ATP-dependent metalloprotease